MIGTVEDIGFTSGGAGNQWTTIDGVRYATYWDILTPALKGLKKGCRVEFTTYKAKLFHNMVEGIPHARVLRVL